MNVVNISDHQQFSSEKMKKNNLFQTPRFFCDIYCFEPGQEQKGHIHGALVMPPRRAPAGTEHLHPKTFPHHVASKTDRLVATAGK